METVRHQHWLPFYDTAGGCLDFDDDVNKPPGFAQILTTENKERFIVVMFRSVNVISRRNRGGWSGVLRLPARSRFGEGRCVTPGFISETALPNSLMK